MGSPVPVEFKMSPTRPFSKLEEPFDRVKPSGSVATFSNLSYEVKTKDGVKLIVDDVSVQVGAGQMLAIMGPS